MTFLFQNNVSTTLAQSVSNTATVINVASGDGAKFPSPSSGQVFAVTLVDASTGLVNEICYCTSRSGDQLTVSRGQEGTSPNNFNAGDTIAMFITAGELGGMVQNSTLSNYATLAYANGKFVSNGNSWYQIFPSGMIMQGGRIATGSNGQLNINFPYTFPNKVLYQNAEESNASVNWSNGTFAAMIGTDYISTSYMSVYSTVLQVKNSGDNPTLVYFGGLPVTVDWIAIGF